MTARQQGGRETPAGGLAPRIEAISDEEAAEVARRLGEGEAVDLDFLGFVATIARVGLGGEGSDGPGLVQGPPKFPRLDRVVGEEALARMLPGSTRPDRLAVLAGLLQVLDSWEASHTAAQEADDLGERITSTYWHMIAHRREPDAGNALYWARRVGRHPILEGLAQSARPILDGQGDPSLVAQIAPGGVWSPAGLIDLATKARPGTPPARLARRLQRIEMIGLLEASMDRAGSSQRIAGSG